jgi:phage terminase large subunit GpA-like protein
MLAVTEPGAHVITVMCCTQLLKTALLENAFGYFAHTDPCPMLLLQPKDEAVEQFSKERISPMIRVTPVLKGLIATGKTRTSDETLRYKAFPGGFLAMASAGSPDNLARRPIRVLLSDEVDKYPVTREGDPIALAEERTATFGVNWLSIRACSPTVLDESRIDASYQDSDMRRASAACPHCNHRQFLSFFDHVQWPKNADGVHQHKQAAIYCEACGAAWSEGDRLKALRTTRWHQTRPYLCCGQRRVPLDQYKAAWHVSHSTRSVEDVWDWWEDPRDGRYAVYRARCPDCGTWPVENTHAGFQASKLFSPWQKDRPADIARKWLAAKGNPDMEQAWWNTQMGLPHRPHVSKTLALDALLARREVYPARVPDQVGVITAGLDIQDYRVEIETVGWGMDEESWSIDYHVIEGEFSDPNTQAAVDAYLKRIWVRADKRGLEMLGACIDSGGHHTQAAYDFCKARIARRIWAIKGASESNGARNPVWPTKRPNRKTKATYRPIVIGGNAGRDTVRGRLLLDAPPVGKPCPGYMHFPVDRDVGYFEQLIADRLVTKTVGSRSFRVWETPAGKANEASDARFYAYAALCGLVHFGLQLNRRVESLRAAPPVEEQVEEPTAEDDTLAPRAPAPPPPDKRGSLVSRLA